MKNSQTVMSNGSRGTKIIRSTGVDNSSMGETGASDIKNTGFKGGVDDVSSSITNSSVRKV